jgi:hypothetical protein
MSTLAMTVLTETETEKVWELPIPAFVYGIIALGLFLLALLLVWLFRNMAQTMIYGPGGAREGQDPLAAAHHGGPHGGGH